MLQPIQTLDQALALTKQMSQSAQDPEWYGTKGDISLRTCTCGCNAYASGSRQLVLVVAKTSIY